METISNPLDKPLEFGNVDQIKALKSIERSQAEGEGLHTFEVTINFSGTYVSTIQAHDEEEAKEWAEEEGFDYNQAEIETEQIEVKQLD